MDLKTSPLMDLLDHGIERRVRRALSSRELWFVHFGTPCTCWSVARRAQGGDTEALGRRCAKLTLRLLRVLPAVQDPLGH